MEWASEVVESVEEHELHFEIRRRVGAVYYSNINSMTGIEEVWEMRKGRDCGGRRCADTRTQARNFTMIDKESTSRPLGPGPEV